MNDQHLSEIKKLEKEVIELNRQLETAKQMLELKDHQIMNIFSNLSHELRTPLNGIVGFSELLSGSDVNPGDVKQYAAVIEESSNMLISVWNDAFDLVKIESSKYNVYAEPFDLNDLIYQLFIKYRPLAEKKNLQLFLENLISEEFIVSLPLNELKKVLEKLIENAIKYTKQGWIKIHYKIKGELIIFEVEDTGIGINESVRSKLFHSFTAEEVSKSRNVSGTGLDLTLCNGLVQLMGGTIEYHPSSGQGSVFRFSVINHHR
ncbi:MAG TPA: HAMP domain-containing sensor histidine kinase [Prolixibacteraceae bacterium]|nr:HAMP domain-containing sensor histidine kinase [Prolixibacteraceae bacterium]HPR60240.1 HAMP domain-containing sensor histidine kinase [Prolixibacteraceae bacterium]